MEAVCRPVIFGDGIRLQDAGCRLLQPDALHLQRLAQRGSDSLTYSELDGTDENFRFKGVGERQRTIVGTMCLTQPLRVWCCLSRSKE